MAKRSGPRHLDDTGSPLTVMPACSRTPRSSRESYDGAKRKKRSKLPLAVDTLGSLLALQVTAPDANERVEVGQLTQTVQAVTDNKVEVAFADQGYKDPNAAAVNGIELDVVKLPEAKKALSCYRDAGSLSGLSLG